MKLRILVILGFVFCLSGYGQNSQIKIIDFMVSPSTDEMIKSMKQRHDSLKAVREKNEKLAKGDYHKINHRKIIKAKNDRDVIPDRYSDSKGYFDFTFKLNKPELSESVHIDIKTETGEKIKEFNGKIEKSDSGYVIKSDNGYAKWSHYTLKIKLHINKKEKNKAYDVSLYVVGKDGLKSRELHTKF